MTLNTYLAVTGKNAPGSTPLTGAELFQLALKSVCIAAGEGQRIATAQTEIHELDGVVTHGTVCGQGLPAWLHVNYRADGSDLYEVDDIETWDDGDEIEQYMTCPAAFAKISWDTAYGFSGPNGMGCTELHSLAIRYVAACVMRRGYGITWKNEYTGEWNEGLTGFEEFGFGGAEAMDWFRNVARPAIAAEMLGVLEP